MERFRCQNDVKRHIKV